MTTVHLVYPHGSRISCPDAIGRNVGQRLRDSFEVFQYNWNDIGVIHPGADDILIGHPHPAPWTIFRRSARVKGWKRILMISPYDSDGNQVAYLESVLPHCDQYLAITGNYWFSGVQNSGFSHWLPKMIHVDLAVDRNDFPLVKKIFNPPGQRRFVYIGHTGLSKNTAYLSKIARLIPDIEIAWIGSGRVIHGLVSLGFMDFSTEMARQLISSYDFMITVGDKDANPATILETMAWGLIPICTPQSGYVNYPGIVNIPLGDAEEVAKILYQLQGMPETQLLEMQAANLEMLDRHFNWDRLAGQVIRAIRSDASPNLDPLSITSRFKVLWTALTSSNSFLRPRNLIRYTLPNYFKPKLKGRSAHFD